MLSTHYHLFINFFGGIKNLYGRFWKTQTGLKEYYLKLDGYFYSQSQACNMAVIRVRNKRTTDLIPIKEIVNDKKYLLELHPVDACIIGLLANNERNGLRNLNCTGWKNMHRFKDLRCFIKSESILEVSQAYTNNNGTEITILRSKHLGKQIEIPTLELCKNQALLYALDSFQAIAVGYEASESLMRQNFNS